MNKDIQQIRTAFNNAIAGSNERNEIVVNDIKFTYQTGEQWKGSYLEQFEGRPKPENNQVHIAVNRVLGQYARLEYNARIMSDSDEATDEAAELLQSRWRNDFNKSRGIEALNNAAQEAFAGGFGAFKLVAKYENEEEPDVNKQYLCIEPIYSAASSVVFNAGAMRKDKSDAKQCWQLIRVNREETEEEYDVSISPFPQATANLFDWNCSGSDKDVYIAHYWEVEETKITVFDFSGAKYERKGRKYFDEYNNQVEKEEIELLKEMFPNFQTTSKKVKEVYYSLIDGSQYLIKRQKTPFKRIPVIPQYGYHAVIEGIEHYFGIASKMRDPQMFMNMYFASLMEVLGERQVPIPEYAPEQLTGGIANNIANEKINNPAFRVTKPVQDSQGNPIHFGPVGMVNPPEIGSGLASAGQFLIYAQDMQAGTGQSTLPANASAEAINMVNERSDDAYQPLFQNAMQSIRAACLTWIDAAQKLYFSVPRSLRVMSEDGSYSQLNTMEYETRNDTYAPTKNTAPGRYDVTVKAGESHKTKKEADRAAAIEILQFTDTSTPIGQMALNTAIMSTTGEGTQTMRKMARYQEMQILLSMGIDPEPKSEEEQEFVQRLIQQMQQPQQPDANTLLAQAEMEKAQADQMDAQVKAFDAETKRMKVEIDAQKIGAEIENKSADTLNKMIDAQQKQMPQLTVVGLQR